MSRSIRRTNEGRCRSAPTEHGRLRRDAEPRAGVVERDAVESKPMTVVLLAAARFRPRHRSRSPTAPPLQSPPRPTQPFRLDRRSRRSVEWHVVDVLVRDAGPNPSARGAARRARTLSNLSMVPVERARIVRRGVCVEVRERSDCVLKKMCISRCIRGERRVLLPLPPPLSCSSHPHTGPRERSWRRSCAAIFEPLQALKSAPACPHSSPASAPPDEDDPQAVTQPRPSAAAARRHCRIDGDIVTMRTWVENATRIRVTVAATAATGCSIWVVRRRSV